MNTVSLKLLMVIGLLVIYPVCLTAQNDVKQQIDRHKTNLEHKLDSLKKLTFKDKKSELKNSRNILRIYASLDLDSALVYAKQELRLAEEIGEPDMIGKARFNCSNILNQQGDFLTAKELLNKNKKENINDTLMALTESALSNIQINTEEYDKAIASGFLAVDLFKSLKDSNNTGFTYVSIAEVYFLALNDEENAMTYINEAIRFLQAQSSSKEYLIAALLTHGDLLVKRNDFNEALNTYKDAEEVAIKYNEYWYFSDIMTKLGKVYYYKKKHKTSIDYLEKAVSDLENNGTSLASRFEYIGLNYKALNQPKKAIGYFNLCMKYEEKPSVLNFYREHLVDCYQKISDYEKALEIQQEITASITDINENMQSVKVSEIVEKYENKKKQQEIETLSIEKALQQKQIQQQQFFIFGTLAFFSIIIAFGIFWYRSRLKLKEAGQKLETTLLQQRFLRTQLNPHFFFHALTSIEGYIYENEKEKAAAFLQRFSLLMRETLEFSDVDFISLQDDMAFIRKYIDLQQLSHNFQFDYTINISDDLNPEQISVPPMLIQPVVENAILHGALNTEQGNVTIDYIRHKEHIEIRVSDNGIIKKESDHSPDKPNRSMSLDITKKRIKNIREVHRLDISYTPLYSDNDQTNSSVSFSIPLEFKRIAS